MWYTPHNFLWCTPCKQILILCGVHHVKLRGVHHVKLCGVHHVNINSAYMVDRIIHGTRNETITFVFPVSLTDTLLCPNSSHNINSKLCTSFSWSSQKTDNLSTASPMRALMLEAHWSALRRINPPEKPLSV